jgi:hypothetical protein
MKVKRLSEVWDKTDLFEDPYKTIPINWENPGQFKVVAFCENYTGNILRQMVKVLYDNDTNPDTLYSTPLAYDYVLECYKKWVDTLCLYDRMKTLGYRMDIIDQIIQEDPVFYKPVYFTKPHERN